MKKIYFIVAILFLGFFSGCHSDCKKCHTLILGTKGPDHELCGDQLKSAQQMQGMECEE